MDKESIFDQAIAEHLRVIQRLREQIPYIHQLAERLLGVLRNGGKILWCGNGGSAAASQHLAAELVGRYKRERAALPSIALTTDSSVLTCVGNDYSYEHVFSRQIEALCTAKDALIAISTSGNSPNVCHAISAAKDRGAFTLAFTGKTRGKMRELAEESLCIDSTETARIQEAHILAGHMICDWIDVAWTTSPASP